MTNEPREAFENPSDVESNFQERYVDSGDGQSSKLLVRPNAASATPSQLKELSATASQVKEVLDKASHGTRFSKDLKSNLDSADMPALMRAVNSTDYLLHAVGRKNLLKILEVGTRESWIRPEVERLVLSVAEIISNAGVEVEERLINVNDLMRVVYFLNRLLDPEISDFLTLNQGLVKRRR
jgi:archaellum component FlaD/FlaE